MLPAGFEIEKQAKLPDGFVLDSAPKSIAQAKSGAIPEGFVLDAPQPIQKKAPFKARHPNLYGIGRGAIVETGKDLSKIAWFKYIYPSEVKRFQELTGYGEDAKWYQPKTKKQAQIRELLLADLEFAVLAQWKPLAEAAKKAVGATLKKYLPKTSEFLTKARSLKKPPVAKPKAAPEVVPPKAAVPKPVETPEMIANREAVDLVVKTLDEAAITRAEQEALYTAEKGARLKEGIKARTETGGEAGYYRQLSKFKGEYTQAQFESIKGKLGQREVDNLFNQIADSTAIGEWEKLPAAKGLAKLFGEFGGKVPTEGELKWLGEIFGEKLVKALMQHRSMFQKFSKAGLEVANIPRAIMASFDLSAPLRQGVFLIGRPKQWAPAFKNMFKFFGSPKAFEANALEIRSRPTYMLMRKAGLALTDLGSMATREEMFQSSYAEMIPGVGHAVKASSQAFTGFIRTLRADTFDDILKNAIKTGVDVENPKFLKDLGRFINAATGRGGLGPLEGAAVPLNTVLFSPRLTTSRLTLLNPGFYIGLEPAVRKEALKSLFTFGTTAATVAGLAGMAGAKMEWDPRSADFMKIKMGNTRFDILGGFQQPIRLAAQFASGKIISSTTGKTLTLGEGYKPITRAGVVGRYFEYKTSPVASFALGLMRGRTSLGERFDVPTEVANRFTPMVMQDLHDLYNEEGIAGVPWGTPAIFGVGVQTYGGVQSWDLKGKDYPELNKELTRLKMSMGFPSTSAFGQELNNKQYKAFKERAGMEIAKELTKAISRPSYSRKKEHIKVKMLSDRIDLVKERVRHKMFPDLRRLSSEIKRIEATTSLQGEEAKELAKERLKRKK